MSSESIYHPDIPDLSPAAQSLSKAVLTATVGELTRTANVVDQQHEAGLKTIADILSLAYTDSPGFRLANDLFTGGGKTTTIASLITVLCGNYRNRDFTGRGILVAVGTTEQADDLMQAVLSSPLVQRLHERKPLIGTYHSEESATIHGKDDAERYPFVIVTHERIKMGDYAHFTNHASQQRLIIWDEALIATKSVSVLISDLLKELADFYAHLKAKKHLEGEAIDERHQQTFDWLHSIEQTLLNVTEDGYVRLPDKPEWLVHRILAGKRKLPSEQFKKLFFGYESRLIETLLNESHRTVRVSTKSHAFWFVVQVPDEFNDVVVLDASSTIRKLLHYDSRIRIVPSVAQKDYSAVTIHYCRAYASRDAMEQRGHAERFYKEIKHIAENVLPEGRRLLTFSLPKKGSVDHMGILESLSEKVYPWSWGKAKGTNQFHTDEYGTHLGVVYRREEELATNAAGQKRNMEYRLNSREVTELQVSEHADAVFQAISRMQNRATIHSKALPSDFWLFYPDEGILNLLRQVMPNVRIVEYVPKFVEPIGASAWITVDRLKTWLQRHNPVKVSMQRLRKECGVTMKADDRVWTKQVIPMLKDTLQGVGYEMQGRSFVRFPV